MINNTIYIVQDLYTLPWSFKVTLQTVSLLLIFSIYSSTNLSISLFLHLQFHNINILQHRMTYHIQIHIY